eukprot:g70518.t1
MHTLRFPLCVLLSYSYTCFSHWNGASPPHPFATRNDNGGHGLFRASRGYGCPQLGLSDMFDEVAASVRPDNAETPPPHKPTISKCRQAKSDLVPSADNHGDINTNRQGGPKRLVEKVAQMERP